MQHDKNDEARNVGKHNTGAHKRRSGNGHFERHAAWERFFFKKTSATLHGSAWLGVPARPAARTYAVRTYVETGAGAQTTPATHPGKKYDVRRPPPHSDNT